MFHHRLRNNVLAAGMFLYLLCPSALGGQAFQSAWPEDAERVWVGPEYWANRLQDWRITAGRLECVALGVPASGSPGQASLPMRTVHLLTRRLGAGEGDLVMSVRTGLVEAGGKVSPQSAAGFLIGVGRELDYRAAALAHHSPGPGGGLFAAIDGSGAMFIRDFSQTPTDDQPDGDLARQSRGAGTPKEVELRLAVKPVSGKYTLTIASHDPQSGKQIGSVILKDIEPERLVGNLALVSHPGGGSTAGRFWFRDWRVSGSKVAMYDDQLCGPILCTQYTLHENTLKLTAQMMPVGDNDNSTVSLQVMTDGTWQTAAFTKIVVPGHTAPFRVDRWDSTRDTPYRVVYDLRLGDNQYRRYTWSGTVRHDPVEKEEIVVAAFTGNHNLKGGVESGGFSWTPGSVWFPHNDVVRYVSHHQPDLLFFSGDQVYQGSSPTRPDLANIKLDYLYKWYLWCWAFRDLARDIPCISIPDDHDVYQGNLWGAGGRKTDKDDRGGYVHPAEFVKLVERTQTSHLPDPYDPTPIDQGIGAYYTDLSVGRVSFAVLEDRKFKSGCNGLVPPTTSGRADHVIDPDFDPKTFDVPGAKLLGDRQLAFLADWAAYWRGADMKAALSQTVFACVATLHGAELFRLVADLDSNGWPQTGRNKALHELRRGFAFMIGGDQHLSTIVHHGIDDWNDAGWSFAAPSIANFYPRAWVPLEPGKNRQPGMPDYTGESLDGLGNHVTVWAATNPGKPTGREPAALHDRMPGYGIVRFNKAERTITMECWPRYADPSNPDEQQYPGWPKTISQLDNYGRRAVAYLPTVKVSGMTDPVLQVIDEASGEIVYTLRIKGASFRPKVFRDGVYTLKVGEPGTDKMKTLQGVQSLAPEKSRTIRVKFK